MSGARVRRILPVRVRIRRRYKSRNCIHQVIEGHWFLEINICLERLSHHLIGWGDCEGDYRDRGNDGILELCLTEVPSVHDRHSQVQQDYAHSRGRPFKQIEGFAAMGGFIHGVAVNVQKFSQRASSILGILDDQDA